MNESQQGRKRGFERLRWIRAVGLLVLAGASLGCGASDAGVPDTDAGVPDADACLALTGMGQGRIDIVFAGLPGGTTGTAEVEGGFVASQSSASLSFFVPAGPTVVRAPRITIDDSTARTVYEPTQGELNGRPICVSAGEIQTVTVEYAQVEPSNKR